MKVFIPFIFPDRWRMWACVCNQTHESLLEHSLQDEGALFQRRGDNELDIRTQLVFACSDDMRPASRQSMDEYIANCCGNMRHELGRTVGISCMLKRLFSNAIVKLGFWHAYWSRVYTLPHLNNRRFH